MRLYVKFYLRDLPTQTYSEYPSNLWAHENALQAAKVIEVEGTLYLIDKIYWRSNPDTTGGVEVYCYGTKVSTV